MWADRAEWIGVDESRLAHPDYGALCRGFTPGDRYPDVVVEADVGGWLARSVDATTGRGRDVVVDVTGSQPWLANAAAERLVAAGYEVDVMAVTWSLPQSRLAVLDRADWEQRTGSLVRPIIPGEHREGLEAMGGVVEGLAVPESGVARVSVHRPGEASPTVVQSWDRGFDQAGLVAAIEGERSRPWTRAESVRFGEVYERLSGSLGPEFTGLLDGVARDGQTLGHRVLVGSRPGPAVGLELGR
ncbi:MAG: zeta toxin family protein [Acidimicrobiales bacterium]